MFAFSDVMSLVTKAVIVGGTLWLGWGGIVLATALKNKNGPELQSGIWQIVGGALILAVGVLFANITW